MRAASRCDHGRTAGMTRDRSSSRRDVTLDALRLGKDADVSRRGSENSQPTYRVIESRIANNEPRADMRRRTRLRAAKIIDGANVFLCEAMIQDRSSRGLRLLLARDVCLPGRFGVHDDLTGEVVTVTTVWRRARTLGVRIQQWGPASALKPSQRSALSGKYYGVRD